VGRAPGRRLWLWWCGRGGGHAELAERLPPRIAPRRLSAAALLSWQVRRHGGLNGQEALPRAHGLVLELAQLPQRSRLLRHLGPLRRQFGLQVLHLERNDLEARLALWSELLERR